MMLLPVLIVSRSSTNPNSAVVHRTISAASRDRWVISRDAAETNSTAKSRSDVASRLFSAIRENPKRSATRRGSMGYDVPPRRGADPRPERRLHKRVDVLRPLNLEDPGVHLAEDLPQPPDQAVGLLGRHDPAPAEHRGVRDAPEDIGPVQAPVERQGGGKR